MPIGLELELPALWVVHYGLLLARTAGLMVFVPIPGLRRAPGLPKIVAAAALAVLLAPLARVQVDSALLSAEAGPWLLLKLLLAEAALGVAVGTAVRLVMDSFGLAAQALGFQAGYSYVNMVDPSSEVDASILNVLFALLAGLLFFTFDLHLFLLRVLADGLRTIPLGAWSSRPADALAMARLSADMVDFAVRLALPAIALLLLIDLTLGLLNQVHSRMQLLTLAFPAKIIAALAVLYPALLQSPRLFHSLAERGGELIVALLSR